ncbi:MAG: DUF937 domain-containing protein [Anaerolineae bacterium]|nr:DUF937 domain-containing protein [Anaerolineae bacterium]
MDALTQQLMQQLSGDDISQISRQIGADNQTTGMALSAAIPLLVSALANNASQPAEAQALHQALAEDHDGSILNNMSGFLGNPQAANGAGILGHILGSQQSGVTQGLAQGTGLNSNQIGQLLEIAAPLLMGLLGQQQQQQGLNTPGLSDFLGGQQQQAQQSNPDMMHILNNLLDMDHDGSALDDILRMASNLFRGR